MKQINLRLNDSQLKRFFMLPNKNFVNRMLINQMMIQQLLCSNTEKQFCDCCIGGVIQNAENIFEDEYVEELLVMLYFQLVIDQTLYYILIDKRLNSNCLCEDNTYSEYDELFNFVKMRSHFGLGQSSPISFLDFRSSDKFIYLLDKKELLIDTKKLLWDNGVKRYLLSLPRADIVNLCEDEFRRDLSIRDRYSVEAEIKLSYLFERRL